MAPIDPTFPRGSEWDEAERRSNLAKHGIDFVRAIAIFEGRVLEERNGRREYGETRLRAFGESGGEVLAVVYT